MSVKGQKRTCLSPREGLEQGGVGAASQFEVALRALEDLIFPNLLQVIG